MPNPERKALAEAITSLAFATQKVAHAESTLEKANNRLCSLFAESAALSEYDAEIEDKRTEGFKMALINDEPTLYQEPAGYATIKLKKERNASEIQAAQEGIKGLEAELEAAREQVADCDNAVELAREAVFCAEAEELAQEFLQKLDDLRRMSHQLRFMAARQVRLRRTENNKYGNAPLYWGSEKSRQISMKPFVIGACHENIMGESDLRGNIKVRDSIAQKVAAYWSALKTDPESRLDEATKIELFSSRVSESAADITSERSRMIALPPLV